jgi:hypothetical protein
MLSKYRNILVGLSLVVLVVSVRGWQNARAELAASKIELTTQRKLNDSTVAIWTTEHLQKDSLVGIIKAKDQLQGKLIAAFGIRVPARDTAVHHDSLATSVSVDSTRIATFRDSTFAGVLEGTVTAPPCCSPLALSYQVHRPAFEPKVGLIEKNGKQVAVVVWQGEQAEITNPYSDVPKTAARFGWFAEGGYTDSKSYAARGGLYARAFRGISGYVAAQNYFEKDARPRAEVGARYEHGF